MASAAKIHYGSGRCAVTDKPTVEDIKEDLTNEDLRFLKKLKQRLIDNYSVSPEDAEYEAFWVGSHLLVLREGPDT